MSVLFVTRGCGVRCYGELRFLVVVVVVLLLLRVLPGCVCVGVLVECVRVSPVRWRLMGSRCVCVCGWVHLVWIVLHLHLHFP